MNVVKYTITLILKEYRTNGDGEAPIYLKIRISDSKLELSTNQFIEPQYWNRKTSQIVGKNDASTRNALLNKIRSDLEQKINYLILSGMEVTVEAVKRLIKGEDAVKRHKLLEVVKEHNLQFEKQVGVKYSAGSYKNYKTSLAFLSEFVIWQYNKKDVLLTDVTHKFCEQFFIWLTTKKTSKHNGATKHIQRLKKIINYAIKMGYQKENLVSSYQLSFRTPPRTALTWDEIERIRNLNVKTERLEQTRDIFLFQVFTGLSYADISVFCRKHIYKGVDGQLWIKMERTKTHNSFAVPILKPALEILNKCNHSTLEEDEPIFSVLSNQKFNQQLKILQELGGISKNLHSHLPRHTFATTVTLQSGVPLETVSKMLGHSKITMTQIYARVGELKIAQDMKELSDKIK